MAAAVKSTGRMKAAWKGDPRSRESAWRLNALPCKLHGSKGRSERDYWYSKVVVDSGLRDSELTSDKDDDDNESWAQWQKPRKY